MKEKFLILSLSNKFGSGVGEALATKLGFYFLNIDDYLGYVLMDSEKMLAECGKVYYDKQEIKSIKDCLDFENTLYFCSYEVFINHKTLFEKNFQIFYLYLPLKILEKQNDSNLVINRIAFKNRNQLLSKEYKTIQVKNFTKQEFVSNLKKCIRWKNEYQPKSN